MLDMFAGLYCICATTATADKNRVLSGYKASAPTRFCGKPDNTTTARSRRGGLVSGITSAITRDRARPAGADVDMLASLNRHINICATTATADKNRVLSEYKASAPIRFCGTIAAADRRRGLVSGVTAGRTRPAGADVDMFAGLNRHINICAPVDRRPPAGRDWRTRGMV